MTNFEMTLNSGHKMPMLGLGTWTHSDSTAVQTVYDAIKVGYRHIDTAQYYGNERGVGRAVNKAIADGLITRDEIFITTKIIPRGRYEYDRAIEQSLNALALDYIDLMLVHQSGAGEIDLYHAMERGVQNKKIRSIGISNYYTPTEFERINRAANITPAVVQNENHPFYQNTNLQRYLERYGTAIASWYPFGGRGNIKEILGNKIIVELASEHGKSPAQIVIRWHIQAGYAALPGTVRHIAEDFDVFDFELSTEEMQSIAKLDRQRRYESF